MEVDDWMSVTRLGSDYEHELSPSTNRQRHRQVSFTGVEYPWTPGAPPDMIQPRPPAVKPEPGSFWQHRSGNLYRVLFIANDVEDSEAKEKYPPTVIYETVANGRKWAGRLDDWHRRMTLQPQLGLDRPVFARDIK